MHYVIYFFIFNAALGFYMLNRVLDSVKGFAVDEARDSKFPAWRRHDVHNWTRGKLFLGAITIMPIRFFSMAGVIISLTVQMKIMAVFMGPVVPGKPVTGLKSWLIKQTFGYHCWFSCLLMGVSLRQERPTDTNYEKWLGPKYDKSGSASTIVAPHTGFVDIVLLLNMLKGNLSFAAMDSLENAPAMGLLCKSLQCLFMPRGASQEIRDSVI